MKDKLEGFFFLQHQYLFISFLTVLLHLSLFGYSNFRSSVFDLCSSLGCDPTDEFSWSFPRPTLQKRSNNTNHLYETVIMNFRSF